MRTLEELRHDREELVASKQDIEVTLSTRNMTDERGRRMRSDQYWAKREELVLQKQRIEKRLRSIKMEIRERENADFKDVAGVHDTEGLFAAASELIHSLKRELKERDEYFELDEADMAVVKLIERRSKGVV